MRRLMGLCLALLASASPGAALERCGILGESVDRAVPALQQPSGCRGEDSAICEMRFAYRAPAARRVFEAALAHQRAKCPGLLAVAEDAAVNHPDSAEAWLFTFQGYGLRVSLKDKAALQQTIVTLWWFDLP